MGFRNNAYAKVWKAEDKGNYSVVELSTSKKNKQTDQYETDFSSKFVRFIGKAHVDISDGVRIKLTEVEVTNSYNKETKQAYTNFLVYGFENADGQLSNPQSKDVSSAISDQFMKISDSISEELPFS